MLCLSLVGKRPQAAAHGAHNLAVRDVFKTCNRPEKSGATVRRGDTGFAKGGGYGKVNRILLSGKSSGQDTPLDASGAAGQDHCFCSNAAQVGLNACGAVLPKN